MPLPFTFAGFVRAKPGEMALVLNGVDRAQFRAGCCFIVREAGCTHHWGGDVSQCLRSFCQHRRPPDLGGTVREVCSKAQCL